MQSLRTWIHSMDCVSYCITSQILLPERAFVSFYFMIRCLILFFTSADSSFVPPLIYAFMGSSRDIAIGPVAVVSLLLGTMLQNELDPINEKAQYQQLAFTATFFAGITQVTLGFFRYSGTYFSSFQKKLN